MKRAIKFILLFIYAKFMVSVGKLRESYTIGDFKREFNDIYPKEKL